MAGVRDAQWGGIWERGFLFFNTLGTDKVRGVGFSDKAEARCWGKINMIVKI